MSPCDTFVYIDISRSVSTDHNNHFTLSAVHFVALSSLLFVSSALLTLTFSFRSGLCSFHCLLFPVPSKPIVDITCSPVHYVLQSHTIPTTSSFIKSPSLPFISIALSVTTLFPCQHAQLYVDYQFQRHAVQSILFV